MDIQVIQSQDDLPISDTAVKNLVQNCLEFAEVNCREVAIHFVDVPAISKLHADFFDDPTPTDCITFPMDEPTADKESYCILGDVFVCPAIAKEYVAKQGINPYHETTLYVVHGLLHLLGYDDIEEADQQAMRQAEQQYLDFIQENNLWLHP